MRIKWTPELESSVIEAIADGSTLRQVGKIYGFSASCIVVHAGQSPEFDKQYARALQIRADLDMDEIDALANAEPERGKFGIDPGWANWQRTRIDAKKWTAARRNPKKWGDKIDVEHSGGINLGLADRLSAARQRVKAEK